jgi:two-component system nitrogen regulation response regulator GlnG
LNRRDKLDDGGSNDEAARQGARTVHGAVFTHACRDHLVGESPPMRELSAALERLALSEVTVLVHGETGTGKELVAEVLHARSLRRSGPFVVCDLAAMSPGLLESELFGHVRGAFTNAERERPGAFALARTGTLFLDEVGELDRAAQPRLLRAIERKQVKPVGGETYQELDVRIVAATHRDLPDEVGAGRFREDLYHRLSVVSVRVPPLRERLSDLPLLADHFLRLAVGPERGAPPQLSDDAMDALWEHDWPGNLRELRNVLERALSLRPEADTIDRDAITLGARSSRPPERPSGIAPRGEPELAPFKDAKDRMVEQWERDYLQQLMAAADNNVSLAAKRAGLARSHLHRLRRKHGLTR